MNLRMRHAHSPSLHLSHLYSKLSSLRQHNRNPRSHNAQATVFKIIYVASKIAKIAYDFSKASQLNRCGVFLSLESIIKVDKINQASL